MNQPRKYIPRLPEPVDPGNPTWVARAWQYVGDRLHHQDTCIDDLKERFQELEATLSAWMTAAATSDKDLGELIEEHRKFHEAIERDDATKRSVWKSQADFLTNTLKFVTQGTVIGIIILVLNKVFGIDIQIGGG